MEINGSNYSAYRPWIFKDSSIKEDILPASKYIIFDINWYNKELLPEIRQEIQVECQKFKFEIQTEYLTLPHEERELSDIDLIIYKIYISQYDFTKFYLYLSRRIVLIPITY